MTVHLKSALFVLGFCSLPLAAADVTGHWNLEGEVAGVPIQAACQFKQDGATFSGSCKPSAPEGSDWKISGTQSSERVTFTHDTEYQGTTYTLNYTGKPEGDTIKGDIDVAGNAGTFTLKKDAGSAAASTGASTALSGVWNLDSDVSGTTWSSTCRIKQDGEKVTGTCKTASNEVPLTGTVSGEKVAWSHAAEYNGEKLTLKYTGTLGTPNQLKGTVDVDPMGVSGTFSAAKAQ